MRNNLSSIKSEKTLRLSTVAQAVFRFSRIPVEIFTICCLGLIPQTSTDDFEIWDKVTLMLAHMPLTATPIGYEYKAKSLWDKVD